jgi:hypothetical protein
LPGSISIPFHDLRASTWLKYVPDMFFSSGSAGSRPIGTQVLGEVKEPAGGAAVVCAVK